MGIQFHSEFPFIRTTINLGWIIDPLMSWGSIRSMRVLYPKALHHIQLAFPTGPNSQAADRDGHASTTIFGRHASFADFTIISQCSSLFGISTIG